MKVALTANTLPAEKWLNKESIGLKLYLAVVVLLKQGLGRSSSNRFASERGSRGEASSADAAGFNFKLGIMDNGVSVCRSSICGGESVEDGSHRPEIDRERFDQKKAGERDFSVV